MRVERSGRRTVEPILMPGPNGVHEASRRLRVVYETVTYQLESADGETVALAGYRRGSGCPISVEIEVEGAWAEWSEDTPSAEAIASMTPARHVNVAMRAERLLRRNLLLAVLPGLEQASADVLAADGGPWEDILVELGWYQKARDASAGEAVAGGQTSPSTGSPALPDSSAATTGSRSARSKR